MSKGITGEGLREYITRYIGVDMMWLWKLNRSFAGMHFGALSVWDGKLSLMDNLQRQSDFAIKEIKPVAGRNFVATVIVLINYGFRGLLFPGSRDLVKDLAVRYNIPVYLFGQGNHTWTWAVYKTDSDDLLEEGKGLNVFYQDPDAVSFSEYKYWIKRIHDDTKERKKNEFLKRAEEAKNRIGSYNLPVELKESLAASARVLN